MGFEFGHLYENHPSFQKAAEKAEGELKPVQEVPVKQSEKDPKTDSGCVVS